MIRKGARAGPLSGHTHLVLYDGVCGLCNGVLRFLLKHDHRGVFRFASLQGSLGQSIVSQTGGDPGELTTFYVVAARGTPAARVLTKSDAALFLAGELGWPWKAARLMHIVPKRIRDGVYEIVARYRYRVFGRYDSCPIPRPEFRSRFID
ncbi:MAG TPA: DCC1-like thiol-disulfide oxidoreductase family protein [Vicinamibacterales bacterium]|jgi:predicted DCC family thiol-disulfide oxidoreductase YuxK